MSSPTTPLIQRDPHEEVGGFTEYSHLLGITIWP